MNLDVASVLLGLLRPQEQTTGLESEPLLQIVNK